MISQKNNGGNDANDRTGAPSRWRRWALRLGQVVFVALVSLLLTEFMARIYLSTADAPLTQEFRINTKRDRVPFVMFGKPPYNGPSPMQPKPRGEYRVVVLGGSTVEHGDPAIPELLEQGLREKGAENLRVFNYGVVSANSGNQLARLVFQVLDLKPDLVVFYDGVNDTQHPMHNDPRPGYSFDHLVYEKHPLISASTADYPLIPLLLYGSEVMRRCCADYFIDQFTQMKSLRETVGYDKKEWRQEIARIYVQNAIKARKISEAHGARFIWFFQPLVNYKEPRTHEEEMMVYHPEHFDELRGYIREEMAAAKRQGAVTDSTAVDLSGVFEGVKEQVFWNQSHIEQSARWIVVDAMEGPILDLIKDDPRLKLKEAHPPTPQDQQIPPLP